MSQSIWKVFRTDEWESFSRTGRFEGSPADLRDGFIHLSSADQLTRTLAKHFADEGMVVVAEIALGSLQSALRWEPAGDGALFPHLYAPLEMGAVIRARRYVRSGGVLEAGDEVVLR